MQLFHTLAGRLAILVMLISVVAGCNNDNKTTTPPAETSSILSLASVPPGFVMADETYRYFPLATGIDVTWSIDQGPNGLEVIDGRVEWTPSAADVGEHRVVLRAIADGVETTQDFSIVVGSRIERASRELSRVSGGSLSVSAPLSAIRGVAITVPANALAEDTKISINEISAAPPFPGTRTAIKAVEFGPDGLSFQYPAIVTLPFDNSGEVDVSRLIAVVYNEDLGRWEPIEVISVDVENGVLHARASHFSIYAAAETAVDYAISVEQMDAGSVCEGRLVARGELSNGIADLEIASVNNLSAEMQALQASNVRGLIADPGFSGSLRFVRVFTLQTHGAVLMNRVLAVTLHAPGDGSATVTGTDSFGNVIFRSNYDDLLTGLTEIDAHLSGLSTHALLGYEDYLDLQVSGRLHVIYSTEDQSYIGASLGRLGLAAVEIPAGAAGVADPVAAGFDVDCDRYRGGYDTFDDSLEPRITASPDEVVTKMEGESVTLTAEVSDYNNPPTSTTWEVVAGDSSATLTETDDDTASRTFVANKSGFYTVRLTVEVDGKTLQHRFNIQMLPKPVANTPPTCSPTALVTTAVEGSPVTLFAAVDDAESSKDSLFIEWGLAFDDFDDGSGITLFPTAGILGSGQVVSFTSASAGNFTIGCRASDGDLWGAIKTTTVSVVAAEVNQPPTDFVVSPASGQAIQGEPITFKASASDPDGDALTYQWHHTLEDAATATTTETGSALAVATAELGAGAYSILVTVTDSEAPAEFRALSLRVLSAPPPPADDDMDGWPASLDCNDADPTINPNGIEICGNAIDENCDGQVVVGDCDQDGYSVNTSPADCNDTNANIYPGAVERCDGVDNNCDGQIDEGFGVGETCSAGLGVCASNGVRQCSADRTRTLCSVTTVAPSPERCDGLDNDCDGQTDEVFELNATCTVGVGACQETGLTSCAADGSGAVCSAVAGIPGEEIYDGIDNDCNGLIDDGVSPPVELCDGTDNNFDGQIDEGFELGGSCTVGIGACQATGLFACSGDGSGTACNAVPGTPSAEIYDGIDNDCNGVIDDGVSPPAEICDGIDNNLNSLVDEGFDLGASCTVGVGACQATGLSVCSGDGSGTVCNAVAGAGSAELCDGIDNDCDGLVDEDGVCDVLGCAAHADEGACSADLACSWSGTECVEGGGAASCGDYAGQASCEMDADCFWNFADSICETLVSATCGTHANETDCANDVYCEWDSLNTMCVAFGGGGGGGASCAELLDEPACLSDTSCAWDPILMQCSDLGGAACDTLMDQTTCEGELGCLWNPALSVCETL